MTLRHGLRETFASAILLCVAAPVCAAPDQVDKEFEKQSMRGSIARHFEKPKAMTVEQTAAFRKDFARCVYQKRKREVDSYLEGLKPMNQLMGLAVGREKTTSRDPEVRSCVSSGEPYAAVIAQFSEATFRAMMKEEAYLSRFSRTPAPDTRATVSRPAASEAHSEANILLNAIADCIVAQDAARADALLRTAPVSAEEKAAAISLATVFGDCLPKGKTLKINAQIMRGLAADGLWARYARTADDHQAR